jgi:hypothetical protein
MQKVLKTRLILTSRKANDQNKDIEYKVKEKSLRSPVLSNRFVILFVGVLFRFLRLLYQNLNKKLSKTINETKERIKFLINDFIKR